MSKRSAFGQGGSDRYGGMEQDEVSDVPRQATAAQLASRKIASLKKRPRSQSPMTNTGSIFEQANQMSASAMPNPPNPFAADKSSFNFGGNTNGAPTTSFGSGGGGFTFGTNTAQNAAPNNGMGFTFSSNASTTPSTSFNFGQQPQSNGTTPSTTFSFGQQPAATNGTAPSTFSFGQNDATPKPAAANIFGNAFHTAPAASTPATNIFGTSTAQPAQNGTPSFTFGASSTQPTNDNTPKPQNNLFAGFNQPKAADSQTSAPATNGWTSFTQNKPADTTSTNTLFGSQSTASTAPTSQPSGAAPSIFGALNAQTAKTPTFKFTAEPANTVADDDFSMMSPENTPQKPTTNIFNSSVNGFSGFKVPTSEPTPAKEAPKPAFEFGKGPGLFGRVSSDVSAPAPAENAAPAPVVTQSTSNSQPSLFDSRPVAAPAIPATQPVPTPVVSKTQSVATSMDATKAVHFTEIRELNEALLQHLQKQDSSKDWSSIFQYYTVAMSDIQQKPAAAPSGTTVEHSGPSAAPKPAFNLGNSLFSKPIESTAASSHNTVESSSQPAYPKLPDHASNTAKLFQAALDKPAASTPATTSLFAPKAPSTATAPSLFSTTASTSAATPLFAPKAADSHPASAGGFKPTGVASAGSSFLSSFGQQAEKTAKSDKNNRKDNDYDSDDGDEAEWEKKDQEEQAKKRAELEAAGKAATGFVFNPSAASDNPNIFKGFGQPKPAVTTASTTPFKGFGQSTEPAQPAAATPAKFGGLTNGSSTPAATAPKLGLFGAPSTPANTTNSSGGIFSAAKPSAPTPLFSFGQTTSTPAAAPTPATQAGEDAEGEDGDAAPAEIQLEDLAILLPAEKAENDIIFHVDKAKSRKLEARPSDGGKEVLTWIDKGLGPLWVLKSKETGKVRVLQKIKDSGRPSMNFAVLPGNGLYKHEGMKGKAVTATFIDHLNPNGGKPSRWMILVGKVEDAEKIAKVLSEQQ